MFSYYVIQSFQMTVPKISKTCHMYTKNTFGAWFRSTACNLMGSPRLNITHVLIEKHYQEEFPKVDWQRKIRSGMKRSTTNYTKPLNSQFVI